MDIVVSSVHGNQGVTESPTKSQDVDMVCIAQTISVAQTF